MTDTTQPPAGQGYYTGKPLCDGAMGLRLIRHDSRGRAHFSEPVFFTSGRLAVATVLSRAGLSGRVEVEGKIENHQADVLTSRDGEWDQTIALDARSYKSLKRHWMRCKTEAVE
ncbi:hypothetical protein [uncultured Sphingomonas sp.]|uniref:hypothetical protein n=1 Tax=uncultured Sphingomonas sp. TaxID=158754 RepID=UPI002634383F|nr:hypothetical protein [uncultured Sphingomonas sp.]